MRPVNSICIAILFTLLSASAALTQGNFSRSGDGRNTICSQNLERYGFQSLFMRANPGNSPETFLIKQKALVSRIKDGRCDIVAVQEVLGSNSREAEQGILTLASALGEATGRVFRGFAGRTNDKSITVGFLVADDAFFVEKVVSYDDDELPKLSERQKPRFFVRLPLEVVLRSRKTNRPVHAVTFHLKSRSGGMKDPAGFMWETVRMESAEKLRALVMQHNRESFLPGGPLLFVLGDRNSDGREASGEILSGSLHLSSFQSPDPVCQLSKGALPVCRPQSGRFKKDLFSVFTGDPDMIDVPGTHWYRKKASWLDDILVSGPTLEYVQEEPSREGDYDSGIITGSGEASDHALVFVRFKAG